MQTTTARFASFSYSVKLDWLSTSHSLASHGTGEVGYKQPSTFEIPRVVTISFSFKSYVKTTAMRKWSNLCLGSGLPGNFLSPSPQDHSPVCGLLDWLNPSLLACLRISDALRPPPFCPEWEFRAGCVLLKAVNAL